MTRTQLESKKKKNQVVSEFTYIEDGADENGFMTYKTVYIETPQNYKLVHIDVESKHAILEDLDYVEPVA